MQKIKFSVIILIAAIAVTSCMKKGDKEKITQIDNMLDQCKSINEDLKGSFLDSVNVYYDSTQISLAYFKENTSPKLPEDRQDLWQAYYHMLSVEKMLKNYKTKHLPQIEEDLALLEKQLNDLRHDIKEGVIEEELKEEYLQAEDSVLSFLTTIAEDRIHHARAHFQKYADNKEDVKTLVEVIED